MMLWKLLSVIFKFLGDIFKSAYWFFSSVLKKVNAIRLFIEYDKRKVTTRKKINRKLTASFKRNREV